MVKLNSILTIEGRGNRIMDVKEIIKQAAEIGRAHV